MSAKYQIRLEEGIAESFEPLSANLGANTNILGVMQRLGLTPDPSLSPMGGKKKYVKSALEGKSLEELIEIGRSASEALVYFPDCADAARRLGESVVEIEKEISSDRARVKLDVVKAESLRKAIRRVFEAIDMAINPDCGSAGDVATRYDLYQGQFDEFPWTLMGQISQGIWSLPDPDLVKLAKEMIQDLSTSIDCEREIDFLAEEIGGQKIERGSVCIAFAAEGKPDINISDLIKGEVDIRDEAGGMVFYGRIGSSAFTWTKLLEWFQAEYYDLSMGSDTLTALKNRLLEAIPNSSPPERLLFNTYWDKTVGISNMNAPALFPQVWLQYDTLTARQRGGESAFKHQRMDFMSFLGGRRVVIIEVDGKHHYSRKLTLMTTGGVREVFEAAPDLYAQMVESDRNLKMRGYEVLRYGGAELQPSSVVSRVDKLLSFFDV